MDELLDDLKDYLKNTPQEIIDKDMEELDEYNSGPDIKLGPEISNKGCVDCACFSHDLENIKNNVCLAGYNDKCEKHWQMNKNKLYQDSSPMPCFQKKEISKLFDKMCNKLEELIERLKNEE